MTESQWAYEQRQFAEKDETPILVAAARDGDQVACGNLYNRYARMVRGILLARVPTTVIEYLTQEVFLSVLQSLHTLRDPQCFGQWLALIARNCAADYWRNSPQPYEFKEEILSGNPHWTDAIFVLETIRSLPDSYSETLILRLAEGMTGPEIAEVTGMTPGSVRVILCRGMKMLREKLGVKVV